MSPKDFSGVFSRQFVVGHFLPAFFALAAAALLTTQQAIPAGYTSASGLGGKLLALGVLALPIGLLLSGLHAHVLRSFAGEATERRMSQDRLIGRSWWQSFNAPLCCWHSYRVKRQRMQYDAWTANHRGRAKDRIAAASYDQMFPANASGMLPTRLGNAIRAFESHADSRYGLDGNLVWPRIEMLLSEQERAVINDARTDVAFFLNCALAVAVLASWILVDHVLVRPEFDSLEVLSLALPEWQWWLAATFVAAITLYRTFRLHAVTAAYRWGTPTRAAVDLHRLELYDRLGLRRPTTNADELALSQAVNLWLGSSKEPPDQLRMSSPEAAAARCPPGRMSA